MKNKMIIIALVVLFMMIFSAGVVAQTPLRDREVQLGEATLIEAINNPSPPNQGPPLSTGANTGGTQWRPHPVPAPNINQGNNRDPRTIWTTYPWERVIINPDIHIPGDERLIPDIGSHPRVLRPNRGIVTDMRYRGRVPRQETLIPGMPRDTIGGELVFRGVDIIGIDQNPNLPWGEVEFPIIPEPTQIEPTITRQTSSLVRRRNFEVLSYDWTFTNHTTRGGLPPWNRVPHNEAYVTFPTTGRWIVTIHPWNRWELHQYERIETIRIHPVTLDEITRITYRHVGYLRTVEGRHTSQPMQTFRILVIRPNETIRVPSPDQHFFESDFELIR